jgi:hypothetical protein
LVYISFKEQKKYNDNQELKNKEDEFIRSIESDIYYLRRYVLSIKYKDSDSIDTNEDIVFGEDFFIKAKKQLNDLYEMVHKTAIFSDEKKLIGAVFEIFYYGVSLNTIDTLKYFLNKSITMEEIKFLIDKIRGKKTRYNKKIVYYGGHQGKMGHYFRQLYYIIDTIENCELPINKMALAKKVRIKMSNYEQAILCYNAFTYGGRNWIEKGYIEKYKLIKNVPPNFLPFDLKKYYKNVFEYEK